MTGRHAVGGTAVAIEDAVTRPARAGRAPTRIRLSNRWRALTGSASAAVAAFALLALGTTVLAVAGPRAGAELRTTAFRQLVAQTPAAQKTIIGTTDDNTMSAGVSPGISDQQILTVQALLLAHLGQLPIGRSFWSGLNVPPVQVADHYPAGLGSDNAYLGLNYRSTLAGNVRVLAGALPGGSPTAGATTSLQVAVTQATAHRFGLVVGSKVPMPDNQVVLQVTGIVRPVDPAGTFWTIDPLAAEPQLQLPPRQEPFWQGEAFIAPSAVLALQTRFQQPSLQISYLFPLELGQLTANQAVNLQHLLAQLLPTAGSVSVNGGQFPMEIALTSGLATLIQGFTGENAAVAAVLGLLSVSLALVGAAVILLAAWLLAERRREEFGVLRARGASRWQLAGVALRGSAVAAVPGVLAGAVVAAVLTPGASAPLGWWLAGLILLVAVAGPVVITVLAHLRVAGAAVRPDAAAGRISSVRRLVAEAGCVLASIGGLVVLREQGLGANASDGYPAAAPILVAVPVAIVLLRVYPLAVRALLRLRGGRAGATTFLGLARAARVPASAVVPAFAMVLALGLVSFAGMVRGAVVRGEVAASWQEAGADAVITGPASLDAGDIRAVAAVPGVSRVLPVAQAAGTIGIAQFGVLVADPGQYASYVAATPLPAVPASFAGGRVAGGGVPVLASPELAARLGRGQVTVTVSGQQVQVRVVGRAPSMSAVPNIGGQGLGGYLVLPRSAYHSAVPDATLLILGSGIDDTALARVAKDGLPPPALVVYRSSLLSDLESAPLQHGAYLALLLGGDAAAGAAMLVLLLTLLMSAGARQMTLARMSTMGLSAGQARRLALIEALPQVLAVLVGGFGCGLALAPLVGPALNLAVFTGSAASVPVLIEPAWLLSAGAALLVLALAVLAGQTVLASRGGAGVASDRRLMTQVQLITQVRRGR